MNEIQELEAWIRAYSPVELQLKKIWDAFGTEPTEADFFRITQENMRRPYDERDPYAIIEAPLSPGVGLQPSSFSENLNENAFFLRGDDISVRKHVRFSPVFRHRHGFIEAIYILHGSCRQNIYFPDGATDDVLFQEGDFCILPPNIDHDIRIFDDTVAVNILIRTSVMKNKLNALVNQNHALFSFFLYTLYENRTPNYLLFHTGRDERIRRLILDMIGEEIRLAPYSQKVLTLMLGLFFTYLQRDYSQDIAFSPTVAGSISSIPQILRYMNDHFADATVSSVARAFSFSPSYLSRIMQQHMHISPNKMIQTIRLDHAAEYLVSTSASVQEICALVGYEDVTHFIRIFREYTGSTPLQYRKRRPISDRHSPLRPL